MTAQSFDLAEQLQTPVIIMSDLDLGMNDNISANPWSGTTIGAMIAAKC